MSHLTRLQAKERAAAVAQTPPRPLTDQEGEASTTLPPFAITADYPTSMVALLFEPDDIPALAAHPLFAHEALTLKARAADCESWIEEQIRDDRDRQILGGRI